MVAGAGDVPLGLHALHSTALGSLGSPQQSPVDMDAVRCVLDTSCPEFVGVKVEMAECAHRYIHGTTVPFREPARR